MCGDGLVNATLLHHGLYLLADTPVVALTEYGFRIVFGKMAVTLDDLQVNCQGGSLRVTIWQPNFFIILPRFA